MVTERDHAWRRLHDPATDAAALAEIAGTHPEFADAIARHPNCYDALRAWADATEATPGPTVVTPESAPVAVRPGTAVVGATPPTATPAAPPRRRRLLVVGIVAGVVVVGGTGAAIAAVMSAAPSPSVEPVAASATPVVSPGARALDGQPVYIGDELSMFLLDGAELAPFIPAAAGGRASDVLTVLGEGEGAAADPAACTGWMMFDESTVVGTRSLSWDAQSYTSDAMTVRQFPTPEFADEWFSTFTTGDGQCARFSFGTPGSMREIDVAVRARSDDDVLVATLHGAGGDRTLLVGHDGNVVLTIEAANALAPDAAQQLVDLIASRLRLARATLTEKIGYR